MKKLILHKPVHGARKGEVHYTSYRVPFATAQLISRIARSESVRLGLSKPSDFKVVKVEHKKNKKGETIKKYVLADDTAISQTEATIQILEQAVALFAVSKGIVPDPNVQPSEHAREDVGAGRKKVKAGGKTGGKVKAKKVAKAKTKPKAKPAAKAAPKKAAKKAVRKTRPKIDPLDSESTRKAKLAAGAEQKADDKKADIEPPKAANG